MATTPAFFGANPAEVLEEIAGGPAKGTRPLGAEEDLARALVESLTDAQRREAITAEAAPQDILTANPNVTAIYSACGPPALGAVQALKNAGKKPGEIILVGFDALPDEVAQIKAGWETASVAQFPAKIGKLGVHTLYQAVKGKKVPKSVDTGTAMVTG